MYPERHEERLCADCDERIDPGQLYVVDGPLHIYCGELRGYVIDGPPLGCRRAPLDEEFSS